MAKRSLLTLEHKQQPLLSRAAFARRLAKSGGASATFVGLSLLAGMVGYHCIEGLAWIDAFANAAMILSGMGPLDAPKTWDGKMFAGWYALYSGLAVILAAGILFTPVVHRMLHWFHLEDRGDRLHSFNANGRSFLFLVLFDFSLPQFFRRRPPDLRNFRRISDTVVVVRVALQIRGKVVKWPKSQGFRGQRPGCDGCFLNRRSQVRSLPGVLNTSHSSNAF